jgi:Ca2+-binding RTX toxin-like protein
MTFNWQAPSGGNSADIMYAYLKARADPGAGQWNNCNPHTKPDADLSGSGNNVNDVITANSGNDTLIAGTASDTLAGGGASDMYVVSAATGTLTTINGSSSADTLSFAAGVSLADLSASTELGNGTLVVTLQNSLGGAVVIDSDAVVNGVTVVTIAESDGSTVTIEGGSLNQVPFADGSAANDWLWKRAAK